MTVYAVAFLVALSLTFIAVAYGGERRHFTATGLLSVVWLATVAAQRITGEYAPYPELALIDFLAGCVILIAASRRWEILLGSTFIIDLAWHLAYHVGGITSIRDYLDGLAVVAYAQLLLVAGMSIYAGFVAHGRVPVLDWLHERLAYRRDNQGPTQ